LIVALVGAQCDRRLAGRLFRKEKLVSQMIERIKELFTDDRDSDA
jgi:hypothetical protein